MLRKSLKHEFRATSRIMLPIFIALLLLSIVTNIFIRLLDVNELPLLLEIIAIFTIIVFFLGIFAVFIGVIVVIVMRFCRGFLSDEGYLTMTLPVSTHVHIFSRLIVAVVWYTLTLFVIFVTILLAVLDLNMWGELFGGLGEMAVLVWQQLPYVDGKTISEIVVFVVELLLTGVVGAISTSLLFYAAVSVGYSFHHHKKGLSIIFVFVFYHVVGIINNIVMVAIMGWDAYGGYLLLDDYVLSSLNIILAVSLGIALLESVAFYFIAHYFLTKKLNLQ